MKRNSFDRKGVHVTPHRKGAWQVKVEGNERATKVLPTQREAIEIGRDRATTLESELYIHRPNGVIRDANSYGNDPYPPKG